VRRASARRILDIHRALHRALGTVEDHEGAVPDRTDLAAQLHREEGSNERHRLVPKTEGLRLVTLGGRP
jgi:hypothetical protein